MIINSSMLGIVYPKIERLRSRLGDFEKSLNDSFMPLSILPIPDDAPDEIPRITTQSKHGHSKLNISPITAQLSTQYDSNFKQDLGNCFSYIRRKSNELHETMKSIIGSDFYYSGVIIECILDDIDITPSEFMRKRFFKGDAKSPIQDIESKVTLIKDNEIYINITFCNTHVFGGQITPTTSFEELESNEVVIMRIDINDRHAYNSNKKYISTLASMKKVLDMAEEIIFKKVNRIISEGVYDI